MQIGRALKLSLLAFACVFPLIFFLAVTVKKSSDIPVGKTNTQEQTQSAMDKGIDFLYHAQLPSGEFSTSCSMTGSSSCTIRSSPFITSFVLYSLRNIKNVKADAIREKALHFLYGLQENGGIWGFTRELGDTVPQDVDDTSVASFALADAHIAFQDNTEAILDNRDETGIFKTWFVKNKDAYGKYEKDRNDCVVNADTALYLSKTSLNKKDIISPVCGYINNAIAAGNACAVYYPSPLTLYYTSARAYENGIACLGDEKVVIVQNILKTFDTKHDTFGSDLDNALALDSLLAFGYRGVEVEKGMMSLLKNQQQDGSWKEDTFFTYSFDKGDSKMFARELTTALAVEASARYQNIQ